MYNTATIVQKDPPSADDRVRLVVEFTGNAGEPSVHKELYTDGGTTLLSIRAWARAAVQALNGRKAITDTLTVPQIINLAAPAPVVPTAEEVWREKALRLIRAKAIGLTNATAVAEIAALQSDVDATYVAGYVDNV